MPAVAFVVAYIASGENTTVAAGVALGLVILVTIVRLARRESPRQAIVGLIGVAIAAFIATRSGKAENFFLPGLLLNAAYATAFLISIAARWPLVGVIAGQVDGAGTAWRSDPARVRAYTRATWLWVGLFALRLAVQLPLYLAEAVVALGIARAAMGLPLFGVGLWLTWLMVRREPRAGTA